jgi:hypothetical protein
MVYDNEPYAHMIPITSVFSGIESMLSKESKRMRVEMIAHGRLDARKQNLTSKEATPEPLVNEPVRLVKNKIYTHLEDLLPRFLMTLVIGLVSVSFG